MNSFVRARVKRLAKGSPTLAKIARMGHPGWCYPDKTGPPARGGRRESTGSGPPDLESQTTFGVYRKQLHFWIEVLVLPHKITNPVSLSGS
jgi:hypothetical protein